MSSISTKVIEEVFDKTAARDALSLLQEPEYHQFLCVVVGELGDLEERYQEELTQLGFSVEDIEDIEEAFITETGLAVIPYELLDSSFEDTQYDYQGRMHIFLVSNQDELEDCSRDLLSKPSDDQDEPEVRRPLSHLRDAFRYRIFAKAVESIFDIKWEILRNAGFYVHLPEVKELDMKGYDEEDGQLFHRVLDEQMEEDDDMESDSGQTDTSPMDFPKKENLRFDKLEYLGIEMCGAFRFEDYFGYDSLQKLSLNTINPIIFKDLTFKNLEQLSLMRCGVLVRLDLPKLESLHFMSQGRTLLKIDSINAPNLKEIWINNYQDECTMEIDFVPSEKLVKAYMLNCFNSQKHKCNPSILRHVKDLRMDSHSVANLASLGFPPNLKELAVVLHSNESGDAEIEDSDEKMKEEGDIRADPSEQINPSISKNDISYRLESSLGKIDLSSLKSMELEPFDFNIKRIPLINCPNLEALDITISKCSEEFQLNDLEKISKNIKRLKLSNWQESQTSKITVSVHGLEKLEILESLRINGLIFINGNTFSYQIPKTVKKLKIENSFVTPIKIFQTKSLEYLIIKQNETSSISSETLEVTQKFPKLRKLVVLGFQNVILKKDFDELSSIVLSATEISLLKAAKLPKLKSLTYVGASDDFPEDIKEEIEFADWKSVERKSLEFFSEFAEFDQLIDKIDAEFDELCAQTRSVCFCENCLLCHP